MNTFQWSTEPDMIGGPISITSWIELSRNQANKPSRWDRFLAWLNLVPLEEKQYHLTVKIYIDQTDYLHIGDIFIMGKETGQGDIRGFVVLNKLADRQYVITNVGPIRNKYSGAYIGPIIRISSSYAESKAPVYQNVSSM